MQLVTNIQDGKLLKTIPLKDGKYLVSVKAVNARTNNQNRYWWGGVLPLVRQGLIDAGYDEVKSSDDAHEVIKSLFLKKHISNTDGVALEISTSTTGLTTIEFNELIASVQKWGSEFLGIEIPSPNEPIMLFN